MVGFDPANPRGINPDLLGKQAEKAFGIENHKAPAFQEVRTYPIGHAIRMSDIGFYLTRIKLSNPRPEVGNHQVLMFYYQGQEVQNPKNQTALMTGDGPLTKSELSQALGEIPGAHLVFLDVAQPKPIDHDWEAGPFLGVLKTVHDGSLSSGGPFPLMSALESALPNIQELGELPGEVEKSLSTPTVEKSVPVDLERLLIGTKKQPGKVAASP